MVWVLMRNDPCFQTEQAQASADKIEAELKDLKATLKNIEDARPFDQLTVDDVVAARPEIRETVEVSRVALLCYSAITDDVVRAGHDEAGQVLHASVHREVRQ